MRNITARLRSQEFDMELLLPDWGEVFWPCELIMMWFSEAQMDISDESQMKEHYPVLSIVLSYIVLLCLGLCAKSFRHSTDHHWSLVVFVVFVFVFAGLGTAWHSMARSVTQPAHQGTGLCRIVESEVAAEIWASRPHVAACPALRRRNGTTMCNRLAVSGFQLHSRYAMRCIAVLVGYGVRTCKNG